MGDAIIGREWAVVYKHSAGDSCGNRSRGEWVAFYIEGREDLQHPWPIGVN